MTELNEKTKVELKQATPISTPKKKGTKVFSYHITETSQHNFVVDREQKQEEDEESSKVDLSELEV